MKLILRWILNAVALMLIPELVSSVKVDSYTAALISAVLLGFVNAIIRPLLIQSAVARALARTSWCRISGRRSGAHCYIAS